MDRISDWCKTVALISIFSAVLLSVIPESKIKGAFKALTTVILVYAFLSPFTENKLDFSSVRAIFDFKDGNNVSEELENSQYYPLIYASEREYEKYITDLILKTGKQGSCEVKCLYKDDKLIVSEVIIIGAFNDIEKEMLKTEIIKISSEDTIIEFKGERDEQ